ncbi:tRNA pseudouridine(38-40) synthase TruA [Dorea sp. D27]|uniref:tRNA pseudouridine(38-40) synthase TruA n=1 Tax=Dorea sp. D27 TaxID=658665 RepID=UPI0006A1080D|nr:tRNA pseudouridine(38-40) synthase TruA [Dorea sp. D27]KMZ52581.1 tRNA pseudouridine synthase A [Dorea sp. D27]
MEKGTGQIHLGTEEIRKISVPNNPAAGARRIRLVIAYDGTDYCGWQIQPNGITIEEVLNKALKRLTGEDIHVIGASRTDSGVHALGNVAVFDTTSSIPPERMSYALNQKLPEDIVIIRSEEVPSGWHPRYRDVVVKTYEYHIYNAPVKNPLRRRTSTHISFPLDVQKMQKGAEYLMGEHDFASFCNVRTDVQDTVRTVTELQIICDGPEIVIRITGNGFLYNMVRIIAGTLIRVGRGFYEPEKVREILEARERTEAGVTAPPNGLVLVGIDYGE